MSMDTDLDFTFAPSAAIYACRAIMLDPVNEGSCYMGGLNARCVGVSAQQSEFAAGMIGNTTFPMILAQPNDPNLAAGSTANVPVYGPGRRCLIDIDPSFAGQIAPNDLIVSGNSGYGTKATPTGSYNQWIIGIALTFANGGQSCNVKVSVFPWLPTGS